MKIVKSKIFFCLVSRMIRLLTGLCFLTVIFSCRSRPFEAESNSLRLASENAVYLAMASTELKESLVIIGCTNEDSTSKSNLAALEGRIYLADFPVSQDGPCYLLWGNPASAYFLPNKPKDFEGPKESDVSKAKKLHAQIISKFLGSISLAGSGLSYLWSGLHTGNADASVLSAHSVTSGLWATAAVTSLALDTYLQIYRREQKEELNKEILGSLNRKIFFDYLKTISDLAESKLNDAGADPSAVKLDSFDPNLSIQCNTSEQIKQLPCLKQIDSLYKTGELLLKATKEKSKVKKNLAETPVLAADETNLISDDQKLEMMRQGAGAYNSLIVTLFNDFAHADAFEDKLGLKPSFKLNNDAKRFFDTIREFEFEVLNKMKAFVPAAKEDKVAPVREVPFQKIFSN